MRKRNGSAEWNKMSLGITRDPVAIDALSAIARVTGSLLNQAASAMSSRTPIRVKNTWWKWQDAILLALSVRLCWGLSHPDASKAYYYSLWNAKCPDRDPRMLLITPCVWWASARNTDSHIKKKISTFRVRVLVLRRTEIAGCSDGQALTTKQCYWLLKVASFAIYIFSHFPRCPWGSTQSFVMRNAFSSQKKTTGEINIC